MEVFYYKINEGLITMGWDVVQIGLRHNLPVHDPFATAKEVAKRMNRNVRLVYRNEYEYDKENNVVREVNGCELIELGKFEVNNSNDYLKMTVSDYQAHQIQEIAGIDKSWLQSELKRKNIKNIEDVFYAGVDKNKKLIISEKYPNDFNSENKFGIE